MRQPHPTDVLRRLRMVACHALPAFMLACCAAGLLVTLFGGLGFLASRVLPL